MEKLLALTQRIQDISAISVKKDNYTTHNVEQGTSISFDLLRNEHVDVFNSFLSKGTIFPLHEHLESDEIFVLYTGDITIICDDGKEVSKIKLQIGKPVVITKCTKHLLKVNADSWVIAVVIPPDLKLI